MLESGTVIRAFRLIESGSNEMGRKQERSKVADRIKRLCLRCAKHFLSLHKHNRLCDVCAAKEDY